MLDNDIKVGSGIVEHHDRVHSQELYNYSKVEEPNSLARKLVSFNFIRKGENLLELGCGSGRDLMHFLKTDAKITCVDISSAALSKALFCKCKAGLKKNLTLHNTDFFSMLLMGSKYDVVYSYSTLHYFDDQRLSKLFRLVYNSLNTEGILAMGLKTKKADLPEWDKLERRYFSLQELKEKLLFAGFEVIDSKKVVVENYDVSGFTEFLEIIARKVG